MNFSLECNWDRTLIDALSGTSVTSLFGHIPDPTTGSGRAMVSQERTVLTGWMSPYIAEVQSLAIAFHIIMDSACLDNREFNRQGYRPVIALLERVDETGVEGIVLALPSLIQIVKRRFPRLKVTVSAATRINSVQKAVYYAQMGVDSICLPQNLNRDFQLLEAIRSKVGCELTLIANSACLYACPHQLALQVVSSHRGLSHSNSLCHFDDPYSIPCTVKKLLLPSEIVRSRWIRPEDIHLYEEVGIDALLIQNPSSRTDTLLRRLEAYSSRRYEGNLVDLLDLPEQQHLPAVLEQMTDLERADQQRLQTPISSEEQAVGSIFSLDNSKIPDNFLDGFKGVDCRSVSCRDCGYCEEIARKALILDTEMLRRKIDEYDQRHGAVVMGRLP